MERVISFNKEGYDPFIDYLKAYSILCVVLSHALPPKFWDYTMLMVWGDMQVPMFVLIQTFHAFKKGIKPQVSAKKLCQRIVYPFIWVQTFIFVFSIGRCFLSSSLSVRNELIETIMGGGKGPGSYYPWVYVQLAFLMPFVWKFFQRYSMSQLLLPFIIVCISFDIFFSLIDIPESLYRLIAVRYIFLIYLGMMWVKDGVRMNWKTISLSILAIIATLFFYYTELDLEPWFFTTGWSFHRWICYFYVGNLLTIFVWFLYKILKRIDWVDKLVVLIAKSSYEIFLVQMAIFVILPPVLGHFIDQIYFRFVVLFTSEILLSVWLGIEFRSKVTNKLYKTK